MPRLNQPRTIASESALARRIAYERERRGQTYENLASRMTEVGCPIQGSGLYKIEKAGRRITVDELVALARAWRLSVEELLQPVEMILHEDIRRVETQERAALLAIDEAVQAAIAARAEHLELLQRAAEGDDPSLTQALEKSQAEKDRALGEIADAVVAASANGGAVRWDPNTGASSVIGPAEWGPLKARFEAASASRSAGPASPIVKALVALQAAIVDSTSEELRGLLGQHHDHDQARDSETGGS